MLDLKDILPDTGETFTVDENIINCLPEGTKVLAAVIWGASAWTKTAKVTTALADGTRKALFVKFATERGAVMMEGEYNSLTAIRAVVPSFAPRPYAWGRCKALPSSECYFLIMDFLDLAPQIDITSPPAGADRFCARLAELHRQSASPTGMFGFASPTCHGKNVQANAWDPSWSAFFTDLIAAFYAEDVRVNSVVDPRPDLDAAFATLTAQTIPRLLEPLQAGGRVLKPCLVHGDLWEENTGVRKCEGDGDDEPVVFDASAMYAHNEYEIGMWRREVVRFDRSYVEEYLRRCPPSEPAAQWEDRHRLYSIKFNLGHSISWPGSTRLRQEIYDDICYLNAKYCGNDAGGELDG
ncbi:Fructosamine kinase-domain-containing protein [Xylariomycetidae sp. FL2044]|nr:Fructosamine kinase-domain-containing protein [Xylariomycetidae sp. FL2044]